MGWKASLIIIENKHGLTNDNAILKAIGKSDYQFDKEVTLDECIYPNDNSINIGYYNGNIIISDDYQITTNSLEKGDKLNLTKEEKGIIELFPNSEIISVACLSTVNYHGYSLINNGIKSRLKISAPDTLIEFGERIDEENSIYANSYQKDGKYYWKDEDDDEDFEEDQMMEDFTFGVAKRRLGVLLDYSDGEELMENVTFKKYIGTNTISEVQETDQNDKKVKWIKYAIIIGILIIWQILKRMVFAK